MNKVILSGRITKDPEFQTTNNGTSLARFTIAVQRKYKNDKNEYDSDFVNIITWRSTADFVSKYLRKGNKVGVVGSIQTRTYEQDGAKKYAFEVVADEVESYTTKGENEGKPKTEANNKQEVMQDFEPIPDSDLPF